MILRNGISLVVNFLSTFSDKKSCNTSTTLQNRGSRSLSAIAELLVTIRGLLVIPFFSCLTLHSQYFNVKDFVAMLLEYAKPWVKPNWQG